jgi:hypothetical protein
VDRLTGACLCGGVSFEISQPPIEAGYCHCTHCQRRTGTAAAPGARLVPGSLRITAGEDLVMSYLPAGGRYSKDFCSVCGSALWSRDTVSGEIAGVRLGALDPGHSIRPTYRQFTASAAEWEPLPDDALPRFPERRPSGGR